MRCGHTPRSRNRLIHNFPVAESEKLHMILLSGNSALRSEQEVAAQDSVQAPTEQLPVREL